MKYELRLLEKTTNVPVCPKQPSV